MRIPPLRDMDLAALDDRELDDHVGAVRALYEQGLEINVLLHGPLGLMLAELAFTCRDLLGWTDAEAFELLTGLSTASTESARQVVTLAEMAAQRPVVRRLSDGSARAPPTGSLRRTRRSPQRWTPTAGNPVIGR